MAFQWLLSSSVPASGVGVIIPVGAPALVAPPGTADPRFVARSSVNFARKVTTPAFRSRIISGIDVAIIFPAGAATTAVAPSVPGGDGGPRSATIGGGAGKPSVAPRIAKSSVPNGMSKLRAYTARPGAGASLVEFFLDRS